MGGDFMKKQIRNNFGVTAIEYALLSTFIAVASVSAIQLTGFRLDKTFCSVSNGLKSGGCSGSSSSNQSSDDSKKGNSSSNSSSSSSSSSNSTDTPKSKTVLYNAKNSYSVRDEYSGYGPNDGSQSENILDEMVEHGMTDINGLFDQYGNAIKTASQLADMFGSKSQYENYASAMDTFNKDRSIKNRTVALDAKKSLYQSMDSNYLLNQNFKSPYSPQIFLNKPSDVSFSGVDPATGQSFSTSYAKHADNYGYGNRDPSHTEAGNFTIPTQSGFGGNTSFQLAFDMPKP